MTNTNQPNYTRNIMGTGRARQPLNIDEVTISIEEAEELERKQREEQERLNRNKPQVPEAPAIIPPSSSKDYWQIPRVKYRNGIYEVHVSKTLLDNGSAKTQDKWAEYSQSAREKGEFRIPDYPLLYNVLERAFDLKDEPQAKATIKEMREAVKGFARKNWLMTLTRLKYTPKGKDILVHNYKMKDEYSINLDFVGADGEIPAGSPESLYQSLFGTSANLAKIDSVFNWLNDTNSNYIWRVNAKPKSLDERVAGFNANSVRAFFNCDGDPTIAAAGLGVRYVEHPAGCEDRAPKNLGGNQ